MPFSQQQTPFAVVDFETDVESRERLRAGELLAARGAFAMVWIDHALIVRRRFGILADFIKLDASLAESIPAIIGLEADIRELHAAPDSILRIPNVSMISTAGTGPRLNFAFYAVDQYYVLVISHASGGSNLEIELSRQIRARLMAEATVAAKSQELLLANAELRIANAKLEQFASIVTHDLKAPMRALCHMTDALGAAVSSGNEEKARRELDELHHQGIRLSSMLSALLRYSSAGPRELAIEPVDTAVLVAEIVRSLPDRQLAIKVRGNWPRLETFAAPLDLVLRNLIDNAIKHHDRDGGSVIITCTDHPSALELAVTDDGPGIAPEHHDSIFLPFRSISGTSEGMGLAIVQKMVAAAGGAIHIRSNTDQSRGVTFVVHWPK